MKTINLKSIKKAFAICCGLMLSLTGFCQTHATMSLKNITSTHNTIEYDLYIMNDGNTTLKLSACSFGVNFDEAILNGGTITYAYVKSSREATLQGLTSFSLASTKVEHVCQLRMTSMPSKYEHAAELLPDVLFKIGRFKITNSVSWTKNSHPSFALMETNKIGLTTTQLVGYKGSSTLLMAFTPSLNTVSTNVEDSPILNPLQLPTEHATSFNGSSNENDVLNKVNLVTLFPNPVTAELNIQFTYAAIGNVKINITDLHGHLVKQIHAGTTSGINSIKIDLSDLTNGMYTLTLLDSKELKYSQPFTKH